MNNLKNNFPIHPTAKAAIVMHLKKNRAFMPYVINRKAYIKRYQLEHAVLFISILKAFNWAISEEGHSYWNNLYRNEP